MSRVSFCLKSESKKKNRRGRVCVCVCVYLYTPCVAAGRGSHGRCERLCGGRALESEKKKKVSVLPGRCWDGGHVFCVPGTHLGDGPVDEVAPLAPPPSPPPLMVPAADITADIMALMEDRSPPPSAPMTPPPPPFCSFSPPLTDSSVTGLIAAIEKFTFNYHVFLYLWGYGWYL